MPTKAQLQEDVNFLTDMQYRFGLAAHSIVLIAYGKFRLAQQRLPDTKYDLENIEKAWAGIPAHRKKGDTLLAIERARNAIDSDGWPSWERWKNSLEKLFRETGINIYVTDSLFSHHYNQMITPQQVLDSIVKRPSND